MNRLQSQLALLCLLPAMLAACGNDTPDTVAAKKQKPAVASPGRSPGKPSAPIALDYEVLGKPVVGLPVAINIRVHATSDAGPVTVQYSVNDASALVFQDGQVERLVLEDLAGDDRQQLAVIPQREGRLYVNVSAEVETPGGTMIKSMAIPIQVGSAPQQPQLNGELREGPDGEAVISMPAVEN